MRLARGLILVLIISHAFCKKFLGQECFVLYAGQSFCPRALAKPLRGRRYFRAWPENVLDGSQHQLSIALIPLRQIQMVSWKQLKENRGQFSKYCGKPLPCVASLGAPGRCATLPDSFFFRDMIGWQLWPLGSIWSQDDF